MALPDSSIAVADDVSGNPLPGPTYPVATVTHSGTRYQEIVQGIANIPHDELVLGYTGDNLTSVTYKKASSTVATLTLGYTGTNLTSVVRS